MIPTIDKVKTGQNLKRMLQERGITPADAAEYLNLSCVQTVYRWFQGVNVPSVDNLYALSRWLNIPMDHMIIGSDTANVISLNSQMLKRMEFFCKQLKSA